MANLPETQKAYSEAAVFAALAPRDLDASFPGAVFRALYLPSFHPEALITVAITPDGAGEVSIASFDRSLWYTLGDRRQPAPGKAPPSMPVRWEECGALQRGQSGELLRAAADLEGVEDEERRFGIDGMRLVGEIRAGAGVSSRRFHAWSPDPGDKLHAYFATIHRVATDALWADRAVCRLEQLHGYLRIGLPVRDLGGKPRRLRIFGALSSHDEGALRELFGVLRRDVPMIVDMSNFDGMGSLLYPVFRDFMERPGPILWLASDRARQQLRYIGVVEEHIVEDVAEALARFAGGAT
jgi:hypothetical protein